jgi:hypothetical protein
LNKTAIILFYRKGGGADGGLDHYEQKRTGTQNDFGGL